MASRFYDTGLSDELWFRKLSPTMKAVFQYLNNKCNHAGVWEIDLDSIEFHVGAKLSLGELLALPVKAVSNNTKIFIPYFISIQYKCDEKQLNPENQVHKSVINILEREGVLTAPPGAPAIGAKDKEEDKNKNCIKGSVRGELPPLAKLWNEHCGELPKVIASNKARDTRIKQRLSHDEEPVLEKWIPIIKRIAASDFCNGKGENKTGWIADFDWLLQPEVRLKVMEGKYDNREKPQQDSGVKWLGLAEKFRTVANQTASANNSEETLVMANKALGEDLAKIFFKIKAKNIREYYNTTNPQNRNDLAKLIKYHSEQMGVT